LEIYRALKYNGYIKSHGLPDTDVFTITPVGLKWFLIQQNGVAKYRKMAGDIDRTIIECLQSGVQGLDVVAERLKLPVLAVQDILYAKDQ